jgi:arsenate reductase (glutaredoxin)
MPLTIYHNPRCSKSRATLALLETSGREFETVLYLETPPDPPRLRALAAMLQLPVAALARRGEPEYREAADLPDPGDEAAFAAWLSAHPRVIERPIVADDERGLAIIGRPPDKLRTLLA